MGTRATRFAPEAYAPDGELWWCLRTHPGTSRVYGDTRKIAAWLAFNVGVDETFTMRDLRTVLGRAPGKPNTAEHLNRRLRELRPDGWVVWSYKDGDLPMDTYRLKRVGWHPGLGTPRAARGQVSARLRREVFHRDGSRCVICGVGSREPYPGDPGSSAVITIGHRIPALRGSLAQSSDELQAECQRCNETVRDELRNPATLPEIRPLLKTLSRDEKDALLRWLRAGHRLRSRLDDVHDKVRALTPAEKDAVIEELTATIGGRRR